MSSTELMDNTEKQRVELANAEELDQILDNIPQQKKVELVSDAQDYTGSPSLLEKTLNWVTNKFTSNKKGAAAIGVPLVTSALVVACSPDTKPAEVRPVKTPEVEPTLIINAEKPSTREILIEAKDPNDTNKKASFRFVENKTHQKDNFRAVVLQDGVFQDYSVFATEGAKDQKIHIEYRTIKNGKPTDFAFIDFALDLPAQVQKDKDFQKKVLEAWDQGKINQIIIDDSKVRITYDIKTNQNYIKSLLAQFLDEVSPKSVFAAELLEATSTPTSTVLPTATVIKIPEATPIPKPQIGYEQKDNSFIYRTEKGEVLTVPQIPGLKAEYKEIEGQKKVIYIAEKGNKYGLKEGERAGSFHPNVSIVKEGVTSIIVSSENNTNLVGGVELRSEVVGVLMEEALAKFEKQEERYITPIPVDISGVKETEQIIMAETTASTEFGQYSFVTLQAPEGLPTTNPNYVKSNGIWVLKSAGRDFGVRSLASRFLESDKIEPGKEMYYLNTTIARKMPQNGFTLNNNSFGNRIVDQNDQPMETTSYTVKFDDVMPLSVRGRWNIALFLAGLYDPRPMNFNHVLAIKSADGKSSPVFLSANN